MQKGSLNRRARVICGERIGRRTGATYQLCLHLSPEKYDQDTVVFALLFFKQKIGEHPALPGRDLASKICRCVYNEYTHENHFLKTCEEKNPGARNRAGFAC